MAFEEIKDPFRRLVRIMERLQEPGGCPWDLEQTHESLKQYMIEETYEAVDAIDRGDLEHLAEELGDMLLQVLFHAALSKRSHQQFTIDDVIGVATRKMIRRHPHVFGDVDAKTSQAVLQNWEKLKSGERKDKAAEAGSGEGATGAEAQPDSVLSGVPTSLPALLRSQRMQEKAARVGFDWPSADGVLDKIEEEVRELREAMAAGDKLHAAEELGDLFFALVNLSRFLKIDAEDAARLAAEKFRRRFAHVENRAHETGRDLHQMTLEEMDEFWNEAKAQKR